jgi:hypothetical protein
MSKIKALRILVIPLLMFTAVFSRPARACVAYQDPSLSIFFDFIHPQATFVRARVTGVEAQERGFVALDIDVVEHLGGERSTPSRVLLGHMPPTVTSPLPNDLAAFRAQFPGEVYLGVTRLDQKAIARRKDPGSLAALLASLPLVIGGNNSCGSYVALASTEAAASANANEWGFVAQLKRFGWITR